MIRTATAGVALALLLAAPSQASTLAELGAATGLHQSASASSSSSAKGAYGVVKRKMSTSSGSTCPIKILSDHGQRVAAQNAKPAKGSSWASASDRRGPAASGWATTSAGRPGSRGAGGWETGAASRTRSAGTAWETNDGKGPGARPRKR
jgi:hypothetical protein